jgi:hypothetical protein
MMNFAFSSSIDKSQIQAPSFNAPLLLAASALLIVVAIAILLDSMSPGTAPADLALMVVFP